jgi:hypothetical protein
LEDVLLGFWPPFLYICLRRVSRTRSHLRLVQGQIWLSIHYRLTRSDRQFFLHDAVAEFHDWQCSTLRRRPPPGTHTRLRAEKCLECATQTLGATGSSLNMRRGLNQLQSAILRRFETPFLLSLMLCGPQTTQKQARKRVRARATSSIRPRPSTTAFPRGGD